MTAPGFPALGRTLPPLTLTAVFVVVALVSSWFAIGFSGWLVVAVIFTVGSAALPRSPLTAALVVLLGGTLLTHGDTGYSASFAVVLAGTHLLIVVGSLLAWLPWRSRVQPGVLRRPMARYAVVQLGAQIVAFVVLSLTTPGSAGGILWLALSGAAAAVVLALTVLVPALLRPTRP